MGLVPLWKEIPAISLPLPCKDTARWLAICEQGGGLSPGTKWAAPLSWTSQPPEIWEINVCRLSYQPMVFSYSSLSKLIHYYKSLLRSKQQQKSNCTPEGKIVHQKQNAFENCDFSTLPCDVSEKMMNENFSNSQICKYRFRKKKMKCHWDMV